MQRYNSDNLFRRHDFNFKHISKLCKLEMWLLFEYLLTFDPKALAQNFCLSFQMYHFSVLVHLILLDDVFQMFGNCKVINYGESIQK